MSWDRYACELCDAPVQPTLVVGCYKGVMHYSLASYHKSSAKLARDPGVELVDAYTLVAHSEPSISNRC